MRSAVLVLMMGWSMGALAQFDFGTYFGSAASDPEIQLLNSQSEFLERENFNLPWFRGADFRIRTNDLDATVEDYRFRLELLNPLERAANKAYNKSYKENLEINRSREFSDLLYLRYQLLARSFELDLEIGRLAAASERIEDFQSLAQAQGDAAKALKLDLQITKLTLEQDQLENERQSLNDFMTNISGLNSAPDWSDFEIINPGTMWRIISLTDTSEVPVVTAVNSELDLAHKEYKLDKANAFRAIGFIQTEYDSERGNMPNEHWGFQVGISIPIFNTDRPQLQYERLDLMELETKSAQLLTEYEQELAKLKQEFKARQNSWETVAEKITKTYDPPATNDLDLLLELFDYQEELAKMGFELHMDLITRYLKILHLQGRLSEKVRINFLSWRLEEY